MPMSLGEIARRLFKDGWADMKEIDEAWQAYARLSQSDADKVEAIGKRYNPPRMVRVH